MFKKILLKILNPLIDEYVYEMFTKDYSDNPFIMVTAVEKLGAKI